MTTRIAIDYSTEIDFGAGTPDIPSLIDAHDDALALLSERDAEIAELHTRLSALLARFHAAREALMEAQEAARQHYDDAAYTEAVRVYWAEMDAINAERKAKT